MPFISKAPMATRMAIAAGILALCSIAFAREIVTDGSFIFAGGSYTSFSRETGSLSSPSPSLSGGDREAFFIGKAFFESDLRHDEQKSNYFYNAKTCTACHRPTKNDFLVKSNGERFGMSIVNIENDIETTFAFYDSRYESIDNAFISPISLLEKKKTFLRGDSEIFRAIPLIGAGIVDAIPDEQILLNEERQKVSDGPESGIAVRIPSKNTNKIARFGWRLSHANLEDQVRSAARNENGRRIESLNDYDVQKIIAYVRFLSVPNRRIDVMTGEEIFTELRCSICHRPYYQVTGIGKVSPFSDFLAHDVGTGKGTIARFRTPPLWGLGMYLEDPKYSGLLHDGRAVDLADAIKQHRGEAEGAALRYRQLSENRRNLLLSWLKEL